MIISRFLYLNGLFYDAVRRCSRSGWAVGILLFIIYCSASSDCLAQKNSGYNWTVSYEQTTKSNTCTTTPLDETARLVFRFTDAVNRQPLSIFTRSTDRIALQSWSAHNSGTLSTTAGDSLAPTEVERLSHLLTLLYWQASLSDSEYRKATSLAQVPYSSVDIDEVNKLYYAPVGLPTEFPNNVLKKDSTWYRAALQQILTDQTDEQKQATEDQKKAREDLEAFGKGRDVLKSLADNLDRQAKTQGANPRLLRNEAHYIRKIANDMQLFREDDHFTFMVPPSVLKKMPHSWFSSVKNAKKVQIKADKVLILVNLLTAFSQNLAVSADRAAQVKELLNYAKANDVALNPDFEAQARSLIEMAGNPSQIVVDTFLDTSVDWVKSNAVPIGPQSLIALTNLLALRLAQSSPALAGSMSLLAKNITRKLAFVCLVDLGSSLLFNTSGIYSGIKTAEFSFHCAEQFDMIYNSAKRSLARNKPAPQSLTSWAMAANYHERSLSSYHANYAELLSGARLAKVLSNLFTQGGVDASIDLHHTLAHRIATHANQWVEPPALSDLLKRYGAVADDSSSPTVNSITSDTVVSAPILVIDRSGSLLDQPGVMQQIQNKAADVVQAIQRTVSKAAVINFSGADTNAVDTVFTNDPQQLLQAIRNPSVPKNGTAIYDAIIKAVDYSATSGEKTMLILFTDGVNHEGRDIREAVKHCEQKGVPVLIVGFTGTEGRNDDDLQALAEGTGGFYVRSEQSSINDILQRFKFYNADKQKTRPNGRAD